MFKTIIVLTALCAANVVFSQNTNVEGRYHSASLSSSTDTKNPAPLNSDPFVKVSEAYHSRVDGITLSEIVERSLSNNSEIKIARLEIEKAKARLGQAGLRANPTLDVEQASGRLAGSPGDTELRVGLSIPVDVNSERKRRIDLATIGVSLREAELSASERYLTGRILRSYVEALSTLSELQVLDRLIDIDTKTVVTVQVRVNEGDVSPLELSLLQAEIEALRVRRSLIESKLQTSLSTLKFYMGLPAEAPLKLSEDIETAQINRLPSTVNEGVALALRSRPEIRVAELEALSASAGLRLIRSQSGPDVTAYVGYSQGRSAFDDPRGSFSQKDRNMIFGVSIGLSIFDRKQGSKAEASLSIEQANERKIFAEAVVKNEVTTLYQRIRSVDQALTTFRTIVLPHSEQNIETIKRVYELGEVTITDLIAEQRKLLQVNRDMTEALTEKYRAQADLFIALGLQFGK